MNPFSVAEQDPARVRELVLMAAYYEGARPGSRHHKCDAVIRWALTWMNLWNNRVHEDMRADRANADIDGCYRQIIEMVRQHPGEGSLMEGRGNLGLVDGRPASPPYTSCRLTPLGAELAERLFQERGFAE